MATPQHLQELSDSIEGNNDATVALQAVEIAGGGRSLRSANIARVDPAGNDSRGRVGDLSRPFLTIQGAVNAIQNGSFNNPVINIGGNSYPDEDVTTSLDWLGFQGEGNYGTPFRSLTCTASPGQIFLTLFQTEPNEITANTLGGLTVEVRESQLYSVTNSGGPVEIDGFGTGSVVHCIAPGHGITCSGFPQLGVYAEINSPGSAVTLIDTILGLLTAAASVSLVNSRIVTNNAGITPAYISDAYLLPDAPTDDDEIVDLLIAYGLCKPRV